MAATVSEQIDTDVGKYTYFNPKLMEAIVTGDIYKTEDIKNAQQQWEIDSAKRPYLVHVKSLSATWPQLRLLADFMEVTTSPMRWQNFFPENEKRVKDRNERASRTKVTRLDYLASGQVIPDEFTTSEALRAALDEQAEKKDAGERQFRLFVVEDLSRDVIEFLGEHYDIEPAFFRDQIFDNAWYNTRDRWVDPPRLNVVAKQQRWLQIRFATARYFKTEMAFTQGFADFESFNVVRRPEDDCNNKAVWDEPGAIVGLSRTRASFWRNADNHKEGAVGVILVDPTTDKGSPLWYGYRNWEETPSMKEKATPPGPPRNSLYTDLIYWAQKPNAFGPSPTTDPASNIHLPIQALLYLVCGEWLATAEYIRTRLGQIEWEISFPDHFLNKNSKIDISLEKLHVWRRLVPLYCEMLAETLQRAFQFPCHGTDLANGGSGLANMNSNPANSTSSTSPPTHCQCPLPSPVPAKQDPITALRDDFVRVHAYMAEHQQHIDRLTNVVTSVISIYERRRGIEDSRNVTRLTWLATFFIPLSFVATLFAMQEDIGNIRNTIKWYFAAALPLAFLSLGLAFVLADHRVQGRVTKIAAYFRHPKTKGGKKNR